MRAAALAVLVSAAIAAVPSSLSSLVRVVNVEERNAALALRVATEGVGNKTVQTPYGPVTGLVFNKSIQFLGVPFAAPPLGDLRWRSPVAPTPWGAYDATRYRDICVQTNPAVWGLLSPGENEDCLYLNIYIPGANHTPPPGGFPIMMWIYGGSWSLGSGSVPIYDGAFDVALEEDVIIVTINYRLEAFGFLAGQALIDESPYGSAGNYGFQDQRAAMKFIADTAAAFSGNPNRVTIFGESAGAGSVSDHLVAPRSWPLFQGAIMESTGAADWSAQSLNFSMSRWPRLVAQASCSSGSNAQQLACLRALNSTQILAASVGLTSGILEWSPVIDGVEFTDTPRKLMAAGKFHKVPVIIGANRDEGTDFNHLPITLNDTAYAAFLQSEFAGSNLTDGITALYHPSDFGARDGASAAWWAATQIFTDSMMLCPSHQAAGWFTAGGNTATFVYYFTHELYAIKYLLDDFKPMGCCHASEIPLVFHLDIALWGLGEVELSKQWVRYWTQFAKTGNPNGAGTNGADPTWSPFGSATQDSVAIFNITEAGAVNISMASGIRSAFCSFWANNIVPEWLIF